MSIVLSIMGGGVVFLTMGWRGSCLFDHEGGMGSAACRNEGHWPPKFSLGGGNNGFGPPPPILEVYNNSNLVNNEVFKKLTTKLASMKYQITETLSDITC